MSELGSLVAIDQAHPWIFNDGVIVTGTVLFVGSFGIDAALRRNGRNVILRVLLLLMMTVVAGSTAMVGLFPWPDQRHGGPDPFGGPGVVAVAFLLTPVLLTLAMWKSGDRILRACLLGNIVLLVALTLVRSNVTGVVRGGPSEGLVQQLFAVVTYLPIGLCSAYLLGSARAWRRIGMIAATGIVAIAGASSARATQERRTFDAHQQLPNGAADISAGLDSIRRRTGMPAFAGAVFGPRGLVASGATGVRKLGDTTRVLPSDRWRLWSDTKAMTAVLIGMYVDAGQLSWDATLPTLFPSIEHMDPRFKAVTLAQLLAHRSGIGEDPVLPPSASYQYDYPGARELLSDSMRPPQAIRAALASLALTHAPYYAPGSRFEYSSWNYIIASSIVERLSGKPWEELLSSRIFLPLGMTSCGFGFPPSHGMPTEPWDHLGSTPISPGIHVAPQSDITRTYGPSSTVVCTLNDWGKFLALFFRDGRRDLISQTALDRITAPASSNNYAMGWFSGPRRGFEGTLLCHTGTNNLSMAMAWVAPGRSRAYMVTANSFTPGTSEIAMATLARLARTFP